MVQIDLNENKNEIRITEEKRKELGILEGTYFKVIISDDKETQYQSCVEAEVEEIDPLTGKKVEVKKQIALKTIPASKLENMIL